MEIVKRKKMDIAIDICWYTTIVFGFWGDYIFSISIPGIGELMPFRIGILVTWMLILARGISNRKRRKVSALQKWCLLFAILFVLFGSLTLLWSIDIGYSLKYIANAFFMVSFFVLFIIFFEREDVLKISQWLIIVNMVAITILGVYEVFGGGIFNPYYDDWKRVALFGNIYQCPVVTSGNTNNYVAQLVFLLLGMTISLVYHVGGKKFEQIKKVIIALCFPFSFFLIQAANARLALIAFMIMCVFYALGMLIIDKSNFKLVILILVGLLGISAMFDYYDKDRTDVTGIKELSDVVQSANSEESVEENEVETDEGMTSVEKRYNLLEHAINVFLESKGLGVGVGNTDMLAKERNVAEGIYNIHCFFARILGDYGIFVIIPLLGIVYNLVRISFMRIAEGMKNKNKETVGQEIVFLGSFIPFMIASTAPSDAQNIVSMWIFVAILVIVTEQKKRQIKNK